MGRLVGIKGKKNGFLSWDDAVAVQSALSTEKQNE